MRRLDYDIFDGCFPTKKIRGGVHRRDPQDDVHIRQTKISVDAKYLRAQFAQAQGQIDGDVGLSDATLPGRYCNNRGGECRGCGLALHVRSVHGLLGTHVRLVVGGRIAARIVAQQGVANEFGGREGDVFRDFLSVGEVGKGSGSFESGRDH